MMQKVWRMFLCPIELCLKMTNRDQLAISDVWTTPFPEIETSTEQIAHKNYSSLDSVLGPKYMCY